MDATVKDEPRWKFIQRVVAFLEKSISPEAEVLHDQRLPDISTGHLRQCDVLIKYGKTPRQLIAIVEVQDRTSKVEIGTLGEWWHKMHAVGAQKLICVSAQDYPQSVKDEVVKKLGPTVTLLRLREMENDEWPFSIGLGPLSFRVPSVSIVPNEPIGILYGPGPLGPGSQVSPQELKLYKDGNDQSATVSELLVDHFDRRGPLGIPEGVHNKRVSIDVGSRLWAEHAGVRQEIRRLEVLVEIKMHVADLPVTVSSYEQVDINGAIAWVTTAMGSVDGEQVQFKMSFVPNDEGQFAVRVDVVGAPRGGYLGIVARA